MLYSYIPKRIFTLCEGSSDLSLVLHTFSPFPQWDRSKNLYFKECSRYWSLQRHFNIQSIPFCCGAWNTPLRCTLNPVINRCLWTSKSLNCAEHLSSMTGAEHRCYREDGTRTKQKPVLNSYAEKSKEIITDTYKTTVSVCVVISWMSLFLTSKMRYFRLLEKSQKDLTVSDFIK